MQRHVLFGVLLLGSIPLSAAEPISEPLPAGCLGRLGEARFRHGTTIVSLALSRDGQSLASASVDDRVILWNAHTGLPRWATTQPYPTSVAFAPDGHTLAVGTATGRVRLLDTRTGRSRHQFAAHAQAVTALSFAPNGRSLFTGSHDQTAEQWLLSGDKAASTPLPFVPRRFGFTPTGQLVAHGSRSGEWVAFSEGKPWPRPPNAPTAITQIGLGTDGQSLWLADSERVVHFSPATGKILHECPRQAVTALAAHAETLFLAAGSRIQRWHIPTGKWRDEPASFFVTAHSWAGHSLLTIDDSGRVLIHDLTNLKEPPHIGENQTAIQVAGSASPVWMLADRLMAYDVATGRKGAVWELPQKERPLALSVSPTIPLLAVGTGTGRIHVGDPVSRKWKLTLVADAQAVSNLAFSNDGRQLAALSRDGRLRWWDINTSRPIREWSDALPDAPLAVNPLTGVLATAEADGGVSFWAARAESILRSLDGHPEATTALTFSPDGHFLLTGGREGAVRLWEVATGGLLGDWPGHRGAVQALGFTSDGSRIWSLGSEGVVLLRSGLPPSRPPSRVLTEAQLAACWKTLGSEDPIPALASMNRLLSDPEQAMPLLRVELKPMIGVSAERIAQLIRQLDDNMFLVREQATAELKAIADQAQPALCKALENDPPPDAARRMRSVLQRAGDESQRRLQRLQLLRAIHVLDRMNSPASRQLLADIVRGAAEAESAELARAILQRPRTSKD